MSVLRQLVEELVVGSGRQWWRRRCERQSVAAEDEDGDGRVDLNFWREKSEHFHSDSLS